MRRALAIRIVLAVAALLTGPYVAWARSPEGPLDLIITPNDGMPALILPGGTFEASLKAKGDLALVGTDGATPVTAEWKELPGDRFQALCRAPENLAVGAYTLELKTLERVDRNLRSVYVFASFPERYIVAHLTDTHIGSNRNPRPSEDILRDLAAVVNASEAAFVLITGDVTENGEAEEFKNFVDILNTFEKPTFVCSGNHDRKGLNYENFFGPQVYAFRFGEDAYLSFDTKDFVTAPELDNADGDLYLLRRAIKPARWAIGFTHRYEESQGMRSQLTVFVDDPLDHLIFGHWHFPAENKIPWGATPYTATGAAINGAMRYFEIGPPPAGIKPGEPLVAVKIE